MTAEEWAEDFKSYLNELQIPRDDYYGIMEYVNEGLSLMKNQEIVRCGECIYANISENGLITCAKFFRSPDWFCADGKKR